MKKEKIAVLGAGEIGRAIEFLAKKNSDSVFLWDKDGSKLRKKINFQEATGGASIIFICAPSWANREIARNVAKNCSGEKKIVLTLSKGLEEGSGKTMPEVLQEELRGRADFGLLGGPMLAGEIREGQPTGGMAGLSSRAWKERLKKIFSETNLKLEFSSDLKGIAVCSVLKNIYSLALGMADGLGLKANSKSFLTVLACREMGKIAVSLGAKAETARSLAGLGDLLATGWSRTSHNYKTGREIIFGGGGCRKSEGCVSLPLMARLLGPRKKTHRIFETLFRIIMEKKDGPKIFFDMLK